MISLKNKKKHPKFNVPNFGAVKRSRVPERWRKQRGIDNKKREKKAFMGAEPTIGYRNPEELRFVKPNGKQSILVHSLKEFKETLGNPDIDTEKFDVTIAHDVSKRLRAEILKVAQDSKITITNSGKQRAPIAKTEKSVSK